MTALLDVRDLTIAFGGASPVVDGVSFEIAAGEIVALVGESGSGKTVAARALLGLLPYGSFVTRGEARFEGRDLLALSEPDRRDVRGARIGMIFQEPMTSLDPSMTVGRQLAEALQLHRGLSEDEARKRSIEMLARVRIADPARVLDRYPHEFSGGMRQRIMIASVMLLQPTLVLADEPTTALDVLVQKEVLDLLLELAGAAGAGVLLITHDLGLVAQYADRIYVMRKGRVVESRATAELLARPREDYTRELLGALPRPELRERQLDAGETLVSAENVKVGFGGGRRRPWRPAARVRALDGVSLDIRRGETVAVVGESGSGKTTLARALVGLVPLTAGNIRFDGVDMSLLRGEALRDTRRRIRIVFQDPFSALDPRMRVGSVVREGLRHDPHLTEAQRAERVALALEEVGLAGDYSDRFPHQLSGGQRQRVNIARALIADPELVIADEPVSALDVTVQAEILKLLDRLQERRRFGCMFISHALSVVEQVADRVVVIYRGRIVEQGSRDEIFRRPRHPYTRALLQAAPRLEGNDAWGYRLAAFSTEARPPPPGFDYLPTDGGSSECGGELVDVAPGHAVACLPIRSREVQPA